jgi:hypothetical protein
MAVWDETPHMAAITLLPLIILTLWRAMENPRLLYSASAVTAIAAAALTSDFGPIVVLVSSLCLLFTVGRDRLKQNVALVLGIGLYSYAIVCPFLSPSNLLAIQTSSGQGGQGWTISSLTAIAIFGFGWALVLTGVRLWTSNYWAQFVSLLAYSMTAISLIDTYLHRHFLPQPNRYRVESEFAIALLLVVVGRVAAQRVPRIVTITFIAILVGLGAEQVVAHRRFAKLALPTDDVRTTIEYRASKWAANNLPNLRMMLPGSIGKWANDFTDVEQFSGGAWSTAYNETQQVAVAAAYNGSAAADEDARIALLWLKAYGTGVMVVPGPNSKETWKGFQNPTKFEGRLPRLWKEEDVSLYATGVATTAYAIPEDSIVRDVPKKPSDTPEIAKYVTALETKPRAAADVRWVGTNHLVVTVDAKPTEVVTIQMTHHTGWKATVDGGKRELRKDGLGLIWVRSNCGGLCRIDLRYDGGIELQSCRIVSYSAVLAGPIILLILRRGRRDQATRRAAFQHPAH